VKRTGLNCLLITHVNVGQIKHLRSPYSNDLCQSSDAFTGVEFAATRWHDPDR